MAENRWLRVSKAVQSWAGSDGGGRGPLTALLIGLALQLGCGAQDLYEPPDAPYTIIGRLALSTEADDVSVIGTTVGVAGGQTGLIMIDVSDPAAPTLVAQVNTFKYAEAIETVSALTGGAVYDIAFVAEGSEGITTYDITDPASTYAFFPDVTGSTAVDAVDICVVEPEHPTDPWVIYQAEAWWGLRVALANPDSPGDVNHVVYTPTPGHAFGVCADRKYAYVADGEAGVCVVDAENRQFGAFRVIATCNTDGTSRDIDIDRNGDHLFVADDDNGLVIMEIDPLGTGTPDPEIRSILPLPGRCRKVLVRDGIAFIAAQDGGVHFVDVSTPASPQYLGTVVTSYATGIDVSESGLVVVCDHEEGLLVLGGRGEFSDHTPPAEVTDLTAEGVASFAVRLRWNAPGDDGLTGTAATYDIRWATSGDSLTAGASWDAARQAVGEPEPGARATAERFRIEGLEPETTYYFALRTADADSNWSPISDVAFATTLCCNATPSLRSGVVTPTEGTADTTFVYSVIYEDGDGEIPTVAEVYINDEAHAMTLASGSYTEGAVFEYATQLPILTEENYSYYFSFSDGHATTNTRIADGPVVGRLIVFIGSPVDELGRDEDESRHAVALRPEIWIAPTEVTQASYESIMASNPAHFTGDDQRPVENVTWLDAIEYCNARTLAEGGGLTVAYEITGGEITWDLNATGYRLPTEAEWEVHCRAGSATAFTNGGITAVGCSDAGLGQVGWYCGNSGHTTNPVGDSVRLEPNAEDLYDMHGNVWEWCWDAYVVDLGTDPVTDPVSEAPHNTPEGHFRVVRGGSWDSPARDCRSAARMPYPHNSRDDIVGFRVVRTIQ